MFDSGLGVYVVLDHADHFYWGGHFLRLHGASWEVSATLGGPWRPYAFRSLPPGLRKTYHSKVKRGRYKEYPPAKGHW